MSTRLLLVRHGETEWHAENRYAGSSEVALTERGERQADALAAFLRDRPAAERPTALYCSPMQRAVRTARPAARALGLLPVIDEGLRELDFGIAEGRTIGELAGIDEQAVARFRKDPVAGAFPGGEPPERAAARGTAALAGIAAAAPEGRVLVVAHNTLIRLTLCALLGIELSAYRTAFPGLDNVAITELQVDGTVTSLLRLNRPVT